MSKLAFLGTPQYAPRVAVALALLILVPGLGSFGFWDKYELPILDNALASAHGHRADDVIDAAVNYYNDNKPTAGNKSRYTFRRAGLLKNKLPGVPAAALTRARQLTLLVVDQNTGEPRSALRQLFNFKSDSDLAAALAEAQQTLASDKMWRADYEGITAQLSQKMLAQERGPPLRDWLIGGVADVEGSIEFSARLPQVIVGALLLIGCYFFAAGWTESRVAVLAVAILASFPLFIFQARQISGDLLLCVSNMAAVWGGLWLAAPRARLRTVDWLGATSLIVGGLVAGHYSGGAAAGVALPAAVICLASLATLLHRAEPTATAAADDSGDASRPTAPISKAWRLWFHAIASIGLLLVAAGAFVIAGTLTTTSLPVIVIGAVFVALAASLVWRFIALSSRPPDSKASPFAITSRRLTLVTLAAATVTGATLGWIIADIVYRYPLADLLSGPNTHNGYVDALFTGWRNTNVLHRTFDARFEELAFGMFPWVALAPIALFVCARPGKTPRQTVFFYTIFAWATLAWVTQAFLDRSSSGPNYPALVAVAIAVAVCLDRLLQASKRADLTTTAPAASVPAGSASSTGTPENAVAIGLFVALASAVLLKDFIGFPEQLAGVHLEANSKLEFPAGVGAKKALIGCTLLFVMAIAVGLCMSRLRSARIRRLGRRLVWTGVGLTVLQAVFLAHIWMPALAERFSTQSVFAYYHEHKRDGDRFGIYGMKSSGAPRYYGRDNFDTLSGTRGVLGYLNKSGRAWAVAPRRDICQLHKSSRKTDKLFVRHDTNPEFMLLANHLDDGGVDYNPLRSVMTTEPPAGLPKKPLANFNNEIELVGAFFPKRAAKARTISMRLVFRVLKPIRDKWKVLVHIDSGIRISGDHEPIGGVCATNTWRKDDYIIDDFEVVMGGPGNPTGNYTVNVGLFKGGRGKFENLKVISGNKDKTNRVRIGKIRVDSILGCQARDGAPAPGVVLVMLAVLAAIIRSRRHASRDESACKRTRFEI